MFFKKKKIQRKASCENGVWHCVVISPPEMLFMSILEEYNKLL